MSSNKYPKPDAHEHLVVFGAGHTPSSPSVFRIYLQLFSKGIWSTVPPTTEFVQPVRVRALIMADLRVPSDGVVRFATKTSLFGALEYLRKRHATILPDTWGVAMKREGWQLVNVAHRAGIVKEFKVRSALGLAPHDNRHVTIRVRGDVVWAKISPYEQPALPQEAKITELSYDGIGVNNRSEEYAPRIIRFESQAIADKFGPPIEALPRVLAAFRTVVGKLECGDRDGALALARATLSDRRVKGFR